ncbi:hypothetical protein ACSBR1_033734 [Camellia fascicularis]
MFEGGGSSCGGVAEELRGVSPRQRIEKDRRATAMKGSIPAESSPMRRPVWPSTLFWLFIGFCASYLWGITAYQMDIFKKGYFLVDVVFNLFLVFSLCASNVIVLFVAFAEDIPTNLFPGYERLGKIVGGAVMLFGNILVHYVTENSVACMLFFLFLAFHWHCVLCIIQPYTDFGILGFLLGASLNKSWSLFRFKGYTWLVLFACIFIVTLRFSIEPLPKDDREDEESKAKLQSGGS